MMVLIVGGSGSGKSEYAEEYIASLSRGKKKYYLATMQILDQEARKKVDRHRKMRAGKGFTAIEQTIDVEKALLKMKEGERTVLLECVSNLTANEMFEKNRVNSEKYVVEKVTRGILELKKKVSHLVVVGNNVFEDGNLYDETTMAYIRAMGKIHTRLAQEAELVVEVVAGIPIAVKGNGHAYS